MQVVNHGDAGDATLVTAVGTGGARVATMVTTDGGASFSTAARRGVARWQCGNRGCDGVEAAAPARRTAHTEMGLARAEEEEALR